MRRGLTMAAEGPKLAGCTVDPNCERLDRELPVHQHSVVPLAQGEPVIFTTRHRPVAGARGHYRATVRHGVSHLLVGERDTLGVVFHDAR